MTVPPDNGGAPPPGSPGHGQVILGSAGDAPRAPDPEHIANLHQLSDPALSDLPLEALLKELLIRIRVILDVDTAAILLFNPDGEELIARAAVGLEEEVERGVRIPLGRGFAGRIAAERVAITVADVEDADIYNPLLRERGVRALLGVPMVVEGSLVGVLHVGTLQAREFAAADAVVLELAAARAAPSIERARLYAALEGEHRAAIALQRSLLPDRLPDLPDAGVAARYLPARDEVGGDWYDVLTLPHGRIGVVIGDVAGHGARAATLMGSVRAAVRAYALEGHPPAVVAGLLNRMLRATRERAMTTFAYAVFDPATGGARYASAGHLPPIVLDGQGARLGPDATGPPVGAFIESEYGEAELELPAGATLLLYTDGLVEVPGESLDVGMERLTEAAAGSVVPHEVCERVLGTMVPAGGARDDIAVVALHNPPIPEELDLRLSAEPETLAPMRRSLRRWLDSVGATADEVAAITLATSEASANAIEHAYALAAAGYDVRARRDGHDVVVVVGDRGRWRPPRGENRGRGQIIMRASMDDVDIDQGEAGTVVTMRRRLGAPR